MPRDDAVVEATVGFLDDTLGAKRRVAACPLLTQCGGSECLLLNDVGGRG